MESEPGWEDKGIKVDVLEDQQGIELYAYFREEKPELDLEGWQGVNAVRKDAQ
jgi:cytosine deaminase